VIPPIKIKYVITVNNANLLTYSSKSFCNAKKNVDVITAKYGKTDNINNFGSLIYFVMYANNIIIEHPVTQNTTRLVPRVLSCDKIFKLIIVTQIIIKTAIICKSKIVI
jgi:hypothetical protein